jgi:hypothetical protein
MIVILFMADILVDAWDAPRGAPELTSRARLRGRVGSESEKCAYRTISRGGLRSD